MLLCSRMILSRWNSWRWYFLLVLRRPIETTGLTFQVGTGPNFSDFPTSMIGLCQEAKSSPDALRRSAGVNSFSAQRVVLASRPWFLFVNRTRLPFAGAADPLPRRLSVCSPASLETNQREHRELCSRAQSV